MTYNKDFYASETKFNKFRGQLTSSTSNVKQGKCFLVSFSFIDLALCAALRHFTKLSGTSSK